MRLDWREYDAEVGPFLNGVAIPEGEPLYGARATSAEIRTPRVFESEEQEKSYWTEWTKASRMNSLDKSFDVEYRRVDEQIRRSEHRGAPVAESAGYSE